MVLQLPRMVYMGTFEPQDWSAQQIATAGNEWMNGIWQG
jgi:hypothetical protein